MDLVRSRTAKLSFFQVEVVGQLLAGLELDETE